MDWKNNHQGLLMILVLILLNCSAKAQYLNRQMFSSQGKSTVLKSGTFISQSIGQLSPSGSFSNKFVIVQQGFQQSAKSKFNKIISFDASSTIVYPNPVADVVNFKFSSEIKGMIKVSILTVSGRQVYRGEKYAVGNILSVESLGYLPSDVYVVYLSALNYNYTAKIIKK